MTGALTELIEKQGSRREWTSSGDLLENHASSSGSASGESPLIAPSSRRDRHLWFRDHEVARRTLEEGYEHVPRAGRPVVGRGSLKAITDQREREGADTFSDWTRQHA